MNPLRGLNPEGVGDGAFHQGRRMSFHLACADNYVGGCGSLSSKFGRRYPS